MGKNKKKNRGGNNVKFNWFKNKKDKKENNMYQLPAPTVVAGQTAPTALNGNSLFPSFQFWKGGKYPSYVNTAPVVYNHKIGDLGTYDKTLEQEIFMDSNMLTHAMAIMLEPAVTVEIGGFGYINEETGEIEYMLKCIEGSAAHVAGAKEYSEAMADGYMAIQKVLNMQFHTHPFFGAFFSSTDTTSHYDTMKVYSEMFEEGTMYYIVYDQLSWMAIRVVYKDKVVRYANCTVVFVTDTGQKRDLRSKKAPITTTTTRVIQPDGTVTNTSKGIGRYDDYAWEDDYYYDYYPYANRPTRLFYGTSDQKEAEAPQAESVDESFETMVNRVLATSQADDSEFDFALTANLGDPNFFILPLGTLVAFNTDDEGMREGHIIAYDPEDPDAENGSYLVEDSAGLNDWVVPIEIAIEIMED